MRVGVLLSQRLAELDPGLDLPALQRWLETTLPAVQAQVRPEPVKRAEIVRVVAESGVERLVLGLAPGEHVAAEVQAQARQAGLDPLGIVVLNLGAQAAVWQPQSVAMERARLLLAAAVARARAFPGSGPEHLKATLAVAVSRRALFTLSAREYRAVPAVRMARCVVERGCRRCVETCPRQAIDLRNQRIELDKARCEGCGLCLEACPSAAIEYPGHSWADLDASIAALLDPDMGTMDPLGLLFLCERSATAIDALVEQGLRYPAGWLPVAVPCTGMLSPALFLRYLALGADAVGVVPCGGRCPFGQDALVAERVEFCQELLRLLAAPPESVRSMPLPSTPPPGKRGKGEKGKGEKGEKGEKADSKTPFSLLPPSPSSPGGAGGGWALPVRPVLGSEIQTPYETPVAPQDPRAGAEAFLYLAGIYGAPPDVALEHGRSPFGLVELDREQCTGCAACADVCPTQALAVDRTAGQIAISFEAGRCLACGLCVPRCPEGERGVLRLRPAVDRRRLAAGRVTLYQDQTPRCQACGAPIAPNAMMTRVAELLGDQYAALAPTISRYCSDCRGVRLTPQ